MKAYVVYGAPGTGKTTYLTNICSGLQKDGKTLYLSFTKAAQEEAAGRISKMLETGFNGTVPATIHSFVYNKLEIERDDIIDAKKLNTGFRKDAVPKSTSRKKDKFQDMMLIISTSEAACIPLSEFYNRNCKNLTGIYLSDVTSLKARYDEWKEKTGCIDFNDMLKLFIENDKLQITDIKHVIIDEAQDLTPLQWKVINKVIKNVETVYIAGDDDQAIYDWAGADAGAMRRFKEAHNAEEIILDKSYRLPEIVKNKALKVIDRVRNRVVKKFSSRTDEGTLKIHSSFNTVKFTGSDTMILYRENSAKAVIENHLIKLCLPYRVINGTSWFYDRYSKAVRMFSKLKTTGILSEYEKKFYDKIWGRDYEPDDWRELMKFSYDRIRYYNNVNLSQEPNITLSTIHSAKGKEADHVILYTGVSKRVFSNFFNNPDAERRVFYVALTRARERLDVVKAGRNNSIIV